jgi:hypothetical protein
MAISLWSNRNKCEGGIEMFTLYDNHKDTKPTLAELEERVRKINNLKNSIRNSELSATLILAAVEELEEKKKEIIRQMLEIINEMR